MKLENLFTEDFSLFWFAKENFFAQFSWSLVVQLPELSGRLQAAFNWTQVTLVSSDYETLNEIQLNQ